MFWKNYFNIHHALLENISSSLLLLALPVPFLDYDSRYSHTGCSRDNAITGKWKLQRYFGYVSANKMFEWKGSKFTTYKRILG